MDMGGQNQLFAELRNALSEADVALSALRVSHRTGVTTFAHAKALANYRRVVELVHTLRCDIDYAKLMEDGELPQSR